MSEGTIQYSINSSHHLLLYAGGGGCTGRHCLFQSLGLPHTFHPESASLPLAPCHEHAAIGRTLVPRSENAVSCTTTVVVVTEQNIIVRVVVRRVPRICTVCCLHTCCYPCCLALLSARFGFVAPEDTCTALQNSTRMLLYTVYCSINSNR